MKRKKKSSLREVIITFSILAVVGVGMIYQLYVRVYQPNIVLPGDISEKYIYIPTDADFNQVIEILSADSLLINTNSFQWVAKQKKYDVNIKPGRYCIKNNFNNNELINLLRSGKQIPIKVTFNNLRNKEQLAGRVGGQIEADSIDLEKGWQFIKETEGASVT